MEESKTLFSEIGHVSVFNVSDNTMKYLNIANLTHDKIFLLAKLVEYGSKSKISYSRCLRLHQKILECCKKYTTTILKVSSFKGDRALSIMLQADPAC